MESKAPPRVGEGFGVGSDFNALTGVLNTRKDRFDISRHFVISKSQNPHSSREKDFFTLDIIVSL